MSSFSDKECEEAVRTLVLLYLANGSVRNAVDAAWPKETV